MTDDGSRMLHTDAFAWYMESDPVLRSTVVAVALLDRAPDWDYLRARLERLTRLVPRLRQRVQEPPLRLGPPRWVVDDAFDLDNHLRRSRLAEPADWSTVLEVARIAAVFDFDRDRPLWEFTLLTGLPDGRAALVTKMHHCLADGIGGLQIAAYVLDPTPQLPPLGPLPDAPTGAAMATGALVVRAVRDQIGDALSLATRAGTAAGPGIVAALRRPVGSARSRLDTAASIGRIVRPILRTASPVMTTRRSNRRLATMDVPLEPLHAAANLHGGHVNDAFLAAITGGLRRYHERHGAAADELRMTLPVSIRKPDDPIGGNRITLLRFALPVAEPDPAARIRVAHERVSAWRNEPAIPLTQAIAFGLNLAPRSYVQGILRRVDFVASDVPGLEQPVYLAGARLLGYYPFGPTIGAAVNTTLLSYVDSCCVGVNVDDSAVPDLEEFMVDLHAGFDEVLALAVPRHRRSRTDGVVPHRRGERQAVAAR